MTTSSASKAAASSVKSPIRRSTLSSRPSRSSSSATTPSYPAESSKLIASSAPTSSSSTWRAATPPPTRPRSDPAFPERRGSRRFAAPSCPRPSCRRPGGCGVPPSRRSSRRARTDCSSRTSGSRIPLSRSRRPSHATGHDQLAVVVRGCVHGRRREEDRRLRTPIAGHRWGRSARRSILWKALARKQRRRLRGGGRGCGRW